MSSGEKAAAVERAKKLLRLAESPNPHEAASARASAQDLIDRFQLSPEDVSGDVLEIVDPKGDRYLEELTRIIGITSGCKSLTSAKGALAFRGKRSEVNLAVATFAALVAELGRCVQPTFASLAERETYFASFRLGFIAAVANRLLLKQTGPAVPGSPGEKPVVPIAKNVIGALNELAGNTEEPDKLFRIRVDAYTNGQAAGYRVALPMIEPSTIALPEGSK